MGGGAFTFRLPHIIKLDVITDDEGTGLVTKIERNVLDTIFLGLNVRPLERRTNTLHCATQHAS